MSNLFKYDIPLDTVTEQRKENRTISLGAIPYLAFVLVCTITTTIFSAIVIILNHCFPGSLDGTYLKLFF